MSESSESLIAAIPDLQRFKKKKAPVFVFGSFQGHLLLTSERVLFLSKGVTGVAQTLAKETLGSLAPAVIADARVSPDAPGSLELPRERIISCEAVRRWDFGRYLRITYREEHGAEKATSFIPAGVASSAWIDDFVAKYEASASA